MNYDKIFSDASIKLILLSLTVTFRQCDGGKYNLFMTDVVSDPSPLMLCIYCCFNIYLLIHVVLIAIYFSAQCRCQKTAPGQS